MTPTSSTSKRTCPVCGARNSGISLFCAECGSSLNVDIDPAGDTAAIPTQSSAPRNTEPFSTAAGDASDTRSWRPSEDQRSDETAPFQTSPASDRWSGSPNGATAGEAAVSAPSRTDHPATVTLAEPRTSGHRGFFLGIVALFLIAVVIALYGWTAWLSADLRDTISGWFDVVR